jgi:acyl-CoA thioesterase
MSDASSLPSPAHAFDASLVLGPTDDTERFSLATSDTYWNMAGPFGGWLFAAGMKAILARQTAGVVPVEAHARFLAAAKPGDLSIRVTCQQQGRSVGFWRALISQNDANADKACCEVSVILASPRASHDLTVAVMPDAPAPDQLHSIRLRGAPVRWVNNYEFRYVNGLPFRNEVSEATTRLQSRLWVREAAARPLDCLNLVALADVVIPRVFLLQAGPSPVATVSMSVYIHATAEEIAASGSPWLLLDITCNTVRRGFFDHAVSIWREDGHLLATSTQLGWFQ